MRSLSLALCIRKYKWYHSKFGIILNKIELCKRSARFELIIMEEIFIGVLFLAALFFMARTFWKQYKADSGCGSCDCGDGQEIKKRPYKLPDHLKG